MIWKSRQKFFVVLYTLEYEVPSACHWLKSTEYENQSLNKRWSLQCKVMSSLIQFFDLPDWTWGTWRENEQSPLAGMSTPVWKMRNFQSLSESASFWKSSQAFSREISIYCWSEKDPSSLLCHCPVSNQGDTECCHFPLGQPQWKCSMPDTFTCFWSTESICQCKPQRCALGALWMQVLGLNPWLWGPREGWMHLSWV